MTVIDPDRAAPAAIIRQESRPATPRPTVFLQCCAPCTPDAAKAVAPKPRAGGTGGAQSSSVAAEPLVERPVAPATQLVLDYFRKRYLDPPLRHKSARR